MSVFQNDGPKLYSTKSTFKESKLSLSFELSLDYKNFLLAAELTTDQLYSNLLKYPKMITSTM